MTSAPHEKIPLPKQSPPENSNFTAPTYRLHFQKSNSSPSFSRKVASIWAISQEKSGLRKLGSLLHVLNTFTHKLRMWGVPRNHLIFHYSLEPLYHTEKYSHYFSYQSVKLNDCNRLPYILLRNHLYGG